MASNGLFKCINLLVVLPLVFLPSVASHGYLIDPANRASLWRLGIPGAIVDLDDNQLYCGGFQRQWNFNDGKCGLCGDDYSLPRPRPYENMGARSRGIVVGTYEEGSRLPVVATITASHKGYFIFHVCRLKEDSDTEDEQCFEKHPLKMADGSGYRYYVRSWSPGNYSTTLQLPRGLTCNRCVLRWQYTAGNSLGVCEDGSRAMGCGPQETFRSCSDIAILPKGQFNKRSPYKTPGFGRKLAKAIGKAKHNIATMGNFFPSENYRNRIIGIRRN